MINGMRTLVLTACLSLDSSGCVPARVDIDKELTSRQIYQQLENVVSNSLEGMQELRLEDGGRILYDRNVRLIERGSIDGRKLNVSAISGIGRYIEFNNNGGVSVFRVLSKEGNSGIFLNQDGNFVVDKNGVNYLEKDSVNIEGYRKEYLNIQID